MATRSTVKFYQGQSIVPVLSVYHHYDGYIKGVGCDLANWLNTKKIVNGIGGENEGVANGIGCLAAQYIAEHKKGAGGLYITNNSDEEEFNYKVRTMSDGSYIIEVEEVGFKGTPDELLAKYG